MRYIIPALFLVLVLLILYMRYEASWLKTEIIDKGDGITIAQLSDIHIAKLKVSLSKIMQILQTEKPDIIVLTGDYIERKSDINCFLKFVGLLVSLCPVYLCLGNHDHKALRCDHKEIANFIEQLEETGTVVLQNKSVVFKKANKNYLFTGIDDINVGEPNLTMASNINMDVDMHIIIAHNPDTVLYLPRGCSDYLLSGHFHGGQIWAPGDIEFKALRKEILCRKGITRGMHRINDINVYINRGLGNVIFPLRFLSRPEITFLRLP